MDKLSRLRAVGMEPRGLVLGPQVGDEEYYLLGCKSQMEKAVWSLGPWNG